MLTSTGQLLDVVRDAGLLKPHQIDSLPSLGMGRCGEARSLARLLVQRGWLTVFQANQVLAGRGSELVIGPYRVLDRLGQGGLSQVFKAIHSDHDWIVALKVIKPEALANHEGRQQFLQEMEAMARLEHPNIVQFCDVDQAGETFYFAMEYVEGIDLGKHVGLGGPLSVTEACDYVRQAALGLQHAHERNLVHRDIKPVNLFLTHPKTTARVVEPAPRQAGTIKILDWGLANLRTPRKLRGIEMIEHLAGGVIGTADYMSPEQARNAQTVDIRGDVYSLGCTLYFLLTGQPPFPDGTLMQKLMAHQHHDPVPVDRFREDVPSGVTAILRRMIAKQPEQRFQTPAAAALALLPFTRESRVGDGIPRSSRPTNAPRSDDTPLPMALGGLAGRMPKAGPLRGGDRHSDTSCNY
jgi:serine/threonine protein kinase